MAKDILKSSIFLNGDFNVGFSDEQHVEDILLTAPGHIKDAPLIGVNITNYMNAPFSPKTSAELEREIRLQLQADGATNIIVKVDPKSQTITTNGTYK